MRASSGWLCRGVTKDYLRIEYDKKDVLYVPVTQLDLLSRYTAPGDSDNVKLSRLGGTDWAKTRKKVKAATEQMAKELIELYARRKQAHGYAFPDDDTWQGDFEQRFAYEETPRPADLCRGNQARYGGAVADGPPALRRCRLWQDRGRTAGGVQMRDGRQAVRDSGPPPRFWRGSTSTRR